MEPATLLQACTAIIISFSKSRDSGRILTEYEMLAYEKACRTVEILLENFEEVWEGIDGESESYPG